MTGITLQIGPQGAEEVEYYRYVASGALMVLGLFLMLEHLITWGGFDSGIGAGHELYGLISVIVGYLLAVGIRFKRK